jgi:hypothetical protein
MTPLEERLAAAMRAAASGAQPPARLTDLIKRRNRKHRVRVTITSVAATAALAVTVPLTAPVWDGAGSLQPSQPALGTGAQPGTVLENCSDQIEGQYGANWQRQSIKAGPLWLVNVRPALATEAGTSQLPFGDLGVNVADNSYVWIKVVGKSRSYFRFLFGATNFGSGNYRLRDGTAGVTFISCAKTAALNPYYRGLTQYWGGFVIAKVPACVTFDVGTGTSGRPVKVTMAVGSIRCPPTT